MSETQDLFSDSNLKLLLNYVSPAKPTANENGDEEEELVQDKKEEKEEEVVVKGEEGDDEEAEKGNERRALLLKERLKQIVRRESRKAAAAAAAAAQRANAAVSSYSAWEVRFFHVYSNTFGGALPIDAVLEMHYLYAAFAAMTATGDGDANLSFAAFVVHCAEIFGTERALHMSQEEVVVQCQLFIATLNSFQ